MLSQESSGWRGECASARVVLACPRRLGCASVDYDAAQLEGGGEMPGGPDVSAIVDQVRARLKQVEDQLGQHQRLAVELERLRDMVKDLEHAVVSRVSGGRQAAAKPAERAKRPGAAKRTTSSARTPRGQNKAKILAAWRAAAR
ncbi:MAG: hypothetical protein M3O90_01920 [Actinomycetota bacterium]|nr:hypothetical protein [Actinomycetota bacterium]